MTSLPARLTAAAGETSCHAHATSLSRHSHSAPTRSQHGKCTAGARPPLPVDPRGGATRVEALPRRRLLERTGTPDLLRAVPRHAGIHAGTCRHDQRAGRGTGQRDAGRDAAVRRRAMAELASRAGLAEPSYGRRRLLYLALPGQHPLQQLRRCGRGSSAAWQCRGDRRGRGAGADGARRQPAVRDGLHRGRHPGRRRAAALAQGADPQSAGAGVSGRHGAQPERHRLAGLEWRRHQPAGTRRLAARPGRGGRGAAPACAGEQWQRGVAGEPAEAAGDAGIGGRALPVVRP